MLGAQILPLLFGLAPWRWPESKSHAKVANEGSPKELQSKVGVSPFPDQRLFTGQHHSWLPKDTARMPKSPPTTSMLLEKIPRIVGVLSWLCREYTCMALDIIAMPQFAGQPPSRRDTEEEPSGTGEHHEKEQFSLRVVACIRLCEGLRQYTVVFRV